MKQEAITVKPSGRWGAKPFYMAKVGTLSSERVLVNRARKFFVGQYVGFAKESDVAGMSVGMAPRWRSGRIWKIEGERIFIDYA